MGTSQRFYNVRTAGRECELFSRKLNTLHRSPVVMLLSSTAVVSPYGHSNISGRSAGCKVAFPRFNVSRVHKRLSCRVGATQQDEEPSETVVPPKEVKESPFTEPFFRALFLGIGTACLLETAHTGIKFFELSEKFRLSEVAAMLPDVHNFFSPLFVADHVAAIGGWIIFYLIDAVAIISVLRANQNDKEAASRAVGNLVTLPKRMLPLRLAFTKRLSTYLLPPFGPRQLSGAAATSSGMGSMGTMSPRRPTNPSAPTATAFVDAPAKPGTVPSLPPQVGLPGTLTGGALKSPLPPPPKTINPPQSDREAREEVEEDNLWGRQETLGESRARRGLRPGQLDPDASSFAKRQRELSGRTSYLKNFWYAAALSEQLKPGEPLGVELCGQKLVLFRGKYGAVRCLGDVCPHRGAPLSGGWVAEVDGHDCVVCPYHGWAFDQEGLLRDVPAAESAGEWPKRPLVDVYPVVERGGFLWVFYGSKELPADERPPIPYVPELDGEGWKAVYGEIEFDCNHHGVFENAIDMAHIHYLHNDSFGNQGEPRIRDMQCRSDAYGVTATFKLTNKPVRGWEWSKVPEVEVTARAMLPSTSVISFTLGNGLSFTTFVNTVPLGPNKTVNRFALIRKLDWDKTGIFNADAWDIWARKAMLRILGEDKEMVEQLRPDLLPQEFSVRADLPQIAFRKLRQQYVDLGYGVTPEVSKERFRSDF